MLSLSLILIGLLLVTVSFLLYKYKSECKYSSDLYDSFVAMEAKKEDYYNRYISKSQLCDRLNDRIADLMKKLYPSGSDNFKEPAKNAKEPIVSHKEAVKTVLARPTRRDHYIPPATVIQTDEGVLAISFARTTKGTLLKKPSSGTSYQGNGGQFDGGGASDTYDAPSSPTPSYESSSSYSSHDSGSSYSSSDSSSSYSSSDSGSSSSCDSGGSCGGCD